MWRASRVIFHGTRRYKQDDRSCKGRVIACLPHPWGYPVTAVFCRGRTAYVRVRHAFPAQRSPSRDMRGVFGRTEVHVIVHGREERERCSRMRAERMRGAQRYARYAYLLNRSKKAT